MDKRQLKTREAIFRAFSTLLSAKSYMRITVQDIIDEAKIGRSTFYAHFETKDYLLKELCTDMFNHVFSESLDTESTHDFSLAGGNPNAMITHILYHLRDSQKNIIGILNGESGALFLRYFKQYLNELVVSRLLKGVEGKEPSVPEDFLVNHISGSFVEMVQWWLKYNMRQSPEDLARFYLAVITPVLSGYEKGSGEFPAH